jgi:catechol 2,3-dioxygenase-like lactoylglutathione lyase family enzyme
MLVDVDQARHGTLHHVELWVPNLDRATISWGWLLGELGYEIFQEWPGGRSWRSGPTYIVIEQSPARTATRHDRCRPGLNHLAFHVESRTRADELSVDAGQHGWRMLFADQYPYAGGTGHYAAYLENADGFEAELVAPSEALLEPPAIGAAPGQAAQSAQAVQVAGGGATQSHGAPPAGSA